MLNQLEAREVVERVKNYGISRVGLVNLAEKPRVEGVDEVLGSHEIVSIAKELRRRR